MIPFKVKEYLAISLGFLMNVLTQVVFTLTKNFHSKISYICIN